MIPQLTDFLVFKSASAEIPCAPVAVKFELAGESASGVPHELIANAAVGVLHYFYADQGRETVTLAEFARALVKVLRGFGLQLDAETQQPSDRPVGQADLRHLACESGKGFELAFYLRLRQELEAHLGQSPRLIRFTGLRPCVKQLAGAQRWSRRCQVLNDDNVGYMRSCLGKKPETPDCALVIV